MVATIILVMLAGACGAYFQLQGQVKALQEFMDAQFRHVAVIHLQRAQSNLVIRDNTEVQIVNPDPTKAWTAQVLVENTGGRMVLWPEDVRWVSVEPSLRWHGKALFVFVSRPGSPISADYTVTQLGGHLE